MATESFNVITGKVRASYANVFEPKAIKAGDKPKYSISLIISKDDVATVKAIKEAIAKATESGKVNLWGGKVPNNMKEVLKDGDAYYPDDAAYANSYFIGASSDTKPGIVDKKKRNITDEDEFYSGCYCLASVNFYPYNFENVSKGVGCGLNNLLKVEDGEKLAGRSNATSDFADYFDDDADPLLG
ncbi:hypothetical protein M2132_001018 [Dysgonomonas sp. PH5-45]|uniref:DUF2815 family protein n=1 Tax=unclassified Dysgonomonas TaxID=2630389 RepID=UPI002474FFDB|nr:MULTISPECIES: DUF2815 family protein [unclassified Dysgonomonas]MDH6354689.1 hypothetical protein [Dysgonomonas sp. PH5-45]MDH6387587.1 hypothetical protein [Dysgonomonas sp. PH5-37]